MKESQMDSQGRTVINARLREENQDMFLKLKRKYNLKYNIEVFHYILRKQYEIEFEKESQ